MSSPTPTPPRPAPPLDDAAYARLAVLRESIRRYLAWAEQRAREHGTTPAHVQLMLAIRAHAGETGPTLTQLADTLLLRHHSVVGLVDRAEAAGLVTRARDPENTSRVHVQLTDAGARLLEEISALHLDWLAEHAGELSRVWASFAAPGEPS